jgi:hypothetical protein
MKQFKSLLKNCFSFLICGAFLFFAKSVVGENSSTTFPVDEAGIAAYVKIDNSENINLEAVANACDSIEKLEESYVVGTVKIENAFGFNYPHIYIGADGWLVAYYLKTEEASRIIQWKGYQKGNNLETTTLKDAIDLICQKTGLGYSTPIKYYDFEFPEANKMTVIVETQDLENASNDFYVRVPGTIYEASYAIVMTNNCCSGFSCRKLTLNLDDNVVYSADLGCSWTCTSPFSSYGYYDLSLFSTNDTHHVVFRNGCADFSLTHTATVLISKN